MQPFTNPNYFAQYQQQINPYQNNISYLQQYPQNIQMQQGQFNSKNDLTVKIVDSMEAVKAADIPMDGNLYYFPKADGSEIYAKQWLPNCTTRILTYKSATEDSTDNLAHKSEKSNFEALNSVKEDISKKLESIENKLSEFEDLLTKP